MIDLHLHTTHSDGSWTPKQLVEKAVELGLRCIAITDHDTMSGLEEACLAAGNRIELIPGIEINTVWRDQDGYAQDVHILGYFLDAGNAGLKELLARQQEARLRLVADTIERLRQLGVKLTFEQVRECAGVGSIGRPHIARAIVKAGGAASVEQAYERFMVRGSSDYVERLNVRPEEAIAAIRAAGGVSSLAHPGKTGRIKEIILKLKAHGLPAIEVYHRRHTVDLVRDFIRFANRNGLAATGGSDCHGPFGDHAPSIGSISVPWELMAGLRKLRSEAQSGSSLSI